MNNTASPSPLSSNKLPIQVLFAIALAFLVGAFFTDESSLFGIKLYDVLDFIGQLFLTALKMVIVPLVVSSIIVGTSSLGSGSDFKKLGGKTLWFYLLTSSLAILVGLVAVNTIQPGKGNQEAMLATLPTDASTTNKLNQLSERDSSDLVEIFLRMIPENVVNSAANTDLLGLIVFSLFFGYFSTRIQPSLASSIQDFWKATMQVMMEITQFVMKFSPIGVFALIGKTIMTTGFSILLPMLAFFITVSLALFIHMFITMPTLLKVLGNINPLSHFKALSPALFTSFATASSSATLPVTIDCVRNNAGVSNKTSGFVLPLGATVNMDGTALYECVAVIFIAQIYNVELSFIQQMIIVITALLSSIGVAGIPSASLVAIALILSVTNLPIEGIALLFLTDRLLDMMRTSVNVFGDSCCAVVVASRTGEAVYSNDADTSDKPQS